MNIIDDLADFGTKAVDNNWVLYAIIGIVAIGLWLIIGLIK